LLRTLAIWPAISNLAYGGVLALSILFLIRVARLGATEVGLLLAVSDLGGLAGALVARRLAKRIGTARTLLLGVPVGGLAGLLIPLTAAGARAALFVVGSGVVIASIATVNIVLISFRQTYTPAEVLGRVIATQRFLVYGTAPLGALLAGVLGTALGVRQALWVLVAVFALSGLLVFTRPILSRRDLPASPEQISPGAQA
jgi:MFS family permease